MLPFTSYKFDNLINSIIDLIEEKINYIKDLSEQEKIKYKDVYININLRLLNGLMIF